MKIGALRSRLILETAVDTQDQTTGEPVRSWTTLGTVWAAIEPIKGREALTDNVTLGEIDTRIRIRWSPLVENLGVKSRAKYVADGRLDVVYDIVSVAEVRLGRREVELMCKSGASEG